MTGKMISVIRELLVYAPLASGMILGVFCLTGNYDWLNILAFLLLMLGIIPVILHFDDNPFLLALGGLFVLAAGLFQCYFIYTVSAPPAREELAEVSGTFASIRVIPNRGRDNYRIYLQNDDNPYVGLTFLGFPGKVISEEAQAGDAVELLYTQDRRSHAIYAFRLNGRELLSYETASHAKSDNRNAAIFFLIIPAAVCGLRLWLAFHGLRKPPRQKIYRYTGRRRSGIK